MVGRLMPLPAEIMTLLVAALIGGVAYAQLADPTKPPAALGAATPNTAAPVATGLQTVIIKEEGRSLAVINGEVVQIGGMVGNQRLVKVSADSVILLGPEGRETLLLTPTAEKKVKVGAGGTAQQQKKRVEK